MGTRKRGLPKVKVVRADETRPHSGVWLVRMECGHCITVMAKFVWDYQTRSCYACAGLPWPEGIDEWDGKQKEPWVV
jgi:hypothetical protein